MYNQTGYIEANYFNCASAVCYNHNWNTKLRTYSLLTRKPTIFNQIPKIEQENQWVYEITCKEKTRISKWGTTNGHKIVPIRSKDIV